MVNAVYTVLAHVDTYVKSATHSRFGAPAVNWRSPHPVGDSTVYYAIFRRRYSLRFYPRSPACQEL